MLIDPPPEADLAAVTQVGPVEQQFRGLIGHENQRQQQERQRHADPTEKPAPLRRQAAAPWRASGFSLIGHEHSAASTDSPIDSDQASE